MRLFSWKAPGIGKKIAQRLILELKGKLRVENPSLAASLTEKQSAEETAVWKALAALIFFRLFRAGSQGSAEEH